MGLRLVPCSLADANAFVAQYHRHSKPVVGHKWSVACADDDAVRGVAIVGRPIARHMDDGTTVEILRTATDGAKNANSLLMGACVRAAFAKGYTRVITYTKQSESGASLRAAGFRVVAQAKGRQWSRSSRPRAVTDVADRLRWEVSTAAQEDARG